MLLQPRKGNSFDESLTKARPWPTLVFQNPVSGTVFSRKSSWISPKAGLFNINPTLFPDSFYILLCMGEASLEAHSLEFCRQGLGLDSAKERCWDGVLKAEKEKFLFAAAAVKE